MKKIKIYTDGACSGNPGPGGWGAILIYENAKKELSGAEKNTTNNRMEIMGVIAALESLKEMCEVEVFSDSSYVCNGITSWLANWKKNNWRGSDKKPIKNQDLWQKMDEILQKHSVKMTWVKGHNGDVMNERADELARNAIYDLL